MLRLRLLKYRLSICSIEGGKIPNFSLDSPFLSITKSEDGLSCVCAEGFEPKNAICERGFVAFKIRGKLNFSLVGILNSILKPLSDASISVFVISTHETDYILIKEHETEKAINALKDICLIENKI